MTSQTRTSHFRNHRDRATHSTVLRRWRGSALAFGILLLAGISSTFAAPPPTWVTKIPAGTWASVLGDNSARDIDPQYDPMANPNFPGAPKFNGGSGYAALWEAWDGGAFAATLGPCGSILYLGGGRDYRGNQVVALNVCGGENGSPLWERLSEPYTGPLYGSFPSGGFPNGTPVIPSTYGLVAVDESCNSLILANTSNGQPNGARSKNAWIFDLRSRQWSGPYPHRGADGGVSAYDSSRGKVWFQPRQGGSGELTSLDCGTGKFGYFGWPPTPHTGDSGSIMGYDSQRDRLVLTTFYGKSVGWVAERRPGSAAERWVTVQQENPPAATWGAHSMAWSPARKAWIVWMDLGPSAQVYELRYRTAAANGTPIYRWKLLTSSGNKIVPIAQSVRHVAAYTKFQLAHFDDGSEVLMGQLRLADGIYAFRVNGGAAAGGTTAPAVQPGTMPPLDPPEPSVPAESLEVQAKGIAPGTWGAIAADNTARVVDPARDPSTNPNYPNPPPYNGSSRYGSVWEAWNSGVLAPSVGNCGSILYFGGGHTDYWGNEVIGLNLCGGKNSGPKWERLSDPYSGPLIWPIADGTFPDNTPTPVHTYDELTFDPVANSMFVAETTESAANAKPSPHSWLFDVKTRKWTGPFKHRGAHYGVSAFDSRRHLIWFQPGQGGVGEITSFNSATKSFSFYGWPKVNGVGQTDSLMGYDALRDKLVLTSFRDKPYVMAEFDPANPTAPWARAEMLWAPETLWGQQTFAWSLRRKAWLVWMAQRGGMVYEVKFTGVNFAGTSQYTWRPLTAATNTVEPLAAGVQTNGPFEKFQVVTTTDGTELLVGQLRLADGVFAFNVPAPGQEPATADTALGTCNTGKCIPKKFQEPGWAQVCAQPGMFVCDNFSDPTTLDGVLVPGDTIPHVADGNLIFDIPSASSANAGGDYRLDFPAIGEGKFVAISYRVKADAAAIAVPSRKEFILWRGTASCTDLQLVQEHYYALPVLSPYTSCGSGSFTMRLANGDYRLHFPDYNCLRSVMTKNTDGCAISHADVWENFYIEVKIGTYGSPNSHVVMWHKSDGGVWKRYIDRADWTFNGDGGFDHFMLTVYTTNKNSVIEHPPGKVLYDHLLMATQPFSVDGIVPTP